MYAFFSFLVRICMCFLLSLYAYVSVFYIPGTCMYVFFSFLVCVCMCFLLSKYDREIKYTEVTNFDRNSFKFCLTCHFNNHKPCAFEYAQTHTRLHVSVCENDGTMLILPLSLLLRHSDT